MKDEAGLNAVFSEQGTAASHTSAAKVLDAIARLPGCSGEDADATGAYTQAELLGEETWVALPSHKWPEEWHKKFKRPVVRLKLSLYGHPLAGLYWEKHCHKHVKSCGFENIPGWECLFVNKEKKLFLSIYVDDFKMAGKSCNIAPMWEKLKKSIELEEPVPLEENVYLGCAQQLSLIHI